MNDGAKIKGVVFSPGREEYSLIRKNSFVEIELDQLPVIFPAYTNEEYKRIMAIAKE